MDALDVARFWSKVEVGDIRKCWPWRSHTTAEGYGQFRMPDKNVMAHRVAMMITFGTPLDGVVVRHKCDNPRCCNPYHLLTGSHADNVADRVVRDRSARGERNGRSKLTEQLVRQIRTDPRPATWVAKELGMTAASVSNIRAGRTWSHVK